MFMEILALTLSYFSTGCNNQLKTEHNMCLKENETHRTTIQTLKNEKEQCNNLFLACDTEKKNLLNNLKKCNGEKEHQKNELSTSLNKLKKDMNNLHEKQLKDKLNSQKIILIKQEAQKHNKHINGINKDHAEKMRNNVHLCREKITGIHKDHEDKIKVMSAKHKEEINSCKDKHKYHHRTQIKYAKQCEHPKK